MIWTSITIRILNFMRFQEKIKTETTLILNLPAEKKFGENVSIKVSRAWQFQQISVKKFYRFIKK